MNTVRIAQEDYFTTSDDVTLFYRCWPTLDQPSQKIIVMFHRGHEHSGRLQHIVDELALSDVTFYAWDARGHGRSPGARGFSPSMARSIKDVDEFVRFIAAKHGVGLESIIVLAQSVGAVLASAWVHDYAPKIRGMILASPAFKVKLYVPFARFNLHYLQKIKGLFFVNSYVKAKYLTHDPERVDSFNHDPLITRAIAVNILLELYETAKRVVDNASSITTPTLLLISGSDLVVHTAPQKQFYTRLNTPIKEQHVLPGFYHDTLGEQHREIAFKKVRAFVEKLYALPPQKHHYTFEDQWSPSADQYRELMLSLKPLSATGLYYNSLRFLLQRFGNISHGIKLGLKTGFDSGSTLDYVYQNQAKGFTPLGKYIDWLYLNSVGWRGIRQRKVYLQQALIMAANQLKQRKLPVKIVDIAAGHGRYILDAIAQVETVESVLLRDYSDINIAQGREMISQRGLSEKVQFEKGNAFDRASLAALTPQPTLGVVSGLYELFSDNALLRESLAGLAAAIPPGGLLVYTAQPWHPQLKMIAYCLKSHRNATPWIMRLRSQAEMDALVEEAGFEKFHQLIDNEGIFTVSIAVRRGESSL